MKTGMRANSLWTATVTVSVADPALLLAVQETCNNYFETETIIQYCKDYGLHHLKLLNSLRNGDQQGVLKVHGGRGLSSECDLKSFSVLGKDIEIGGEEDLTKRLCTCTSGTGFPVLAWQVVRTASPGLTLWVNCVS